MLCQVSSLQSGPTCQKVIKWAKSPDQCYLQNVYRIRGDFCKKLVTWWFSANDAPNMVVFCNSPACLDCPLAGFWDGLHSLLSLQDIKLFWPSHILKGTKVWVHNKLRFPQYLLLQVLGCWNDRKETDKNLRWYSAFNNAACGEIIELEPREDWHWLDLQILMQAHKK